MPVSKKKFLSPEVLHTTAEQMLADAQASGVRAALLGGFAMQLYGSPRLTGDLDFVTERIYPMGLPILRDLSFGGVVVQGPNGVEMDWIIREDHYKDLYEEALDMTVTIEGLPTVRPEYLAAMKFATHRGKDEQDVQWLISEGVIDLDKTRDIIRRLVGGPFAVEEFNLLVAEVEWRKGHLGEW